MLERYKPGFTFFSILVIIAIIFPPIVWQTSVRILDTGYAFIFAIPKTQYGLAGSIDITKLLIEIILIVAISILFQINYEKIKIWFKTNHKSVFDTNDEDDESK